jgi:hypothetical protein
MGTALLSQADLLLLRRQGVKLGDERRPLQGAALREVLQRAEQHSVPLIRTLFPTELQLAREAERAGIPLPDQRGAAAVTSIKVTGRRQLPRVLRQRDIDSVVVFGPDGFVVRPIERRVRVGMRRKPVHPGS